MKAGVALLRMIVGGLFMGHGLQKLTGWFGGNGLQATGEAFESMGLRPGVRHAGAAGAAETAGGALLAAGLATPVGAAMVTGSMVTAIRKVHARNGVWVTNGGFEYNLVLLACVFAITDVGPGDWSLDAALGRRRWGLPWAIAQLAAGAAASSVTLALAERPQGSAPDAADAATASNGQLPAEEPARA